MKGARRRYEELRIELLLKRALNRGPLTQAEEVRYVGELDRCWRAMTDDEQDALERSLSELRCSLAPDELSEVDQVVEPRTHQMPRRAAA